MSDERHPRREHSGEPIARPNAEPDAADDAEREADLLVQLLGRHLLRGPGGDEADGARFHDWWARELRARLDAAERSRLDRRADAYAARMAERLALVRSPVRRVAGRPVSRPPSAVEPLAAALRSAVRERCAPMLDLSVAAGAGRELWDEPPAAWVELPEGMPEGEYVALAVSGDSMEPLLRAGDTILVRLGSAPVRDAVVVARHPDDGYVVKRVAGVTDARLELASLNPAYAPISLPRRADLVLGSVVLCWSERGEAA